MELGTYTPVDPKSVFEKIEFKVLHPIQHDLICQRPGLSPDQISILNLSTPRAQYRSDQHIERPCY